MALRSERKVVQMKKLIKAAAVLTAAAFLGGTGTYGYFSDTLKVKNHISTGDINIGLKEYEKKRKYRGIFCRNQGSSSGRCYIQNSQNHQLCKPLLGAGTDHLQK